MSRTKILVVDDQPVRCNLVADILSAQERFAVVGQACDGQEAIHRAKQTQPDVILLDIQLSELGGLEVTRLLQTEVPRVNVMVYTFSTNNDDLYAAMEAGARGYILRSAGSTDLIQAVLRVARGEIVVSPEMGSSETVEVGEVEVERDIRQRPGLRRRVSTGRGI